MGKQDSIDREISPGAGRGRQDRSLASDVAYDVQRILYRKWAVSAIEFTLKILLAGLCLWLMWRGAASLFAPAPAAPETAAMPEATAAAQAPVPPDGPAGGVGIKAFLACILAILLLPVATISFIRTMVSKRSNGVNALTLGIYTTAGFILSYFMAGASLETAGRAVLFLGTGLFSLLYNFTVMNYALKLEDGR